MILALIVSSSDSSVGSISEQGAGDIVLSSGNHLLVSHGVFSASLPKGELMGFAGAASVSVYSDSVTIAALSTPVAVHVNDAWMIVPAEMQWSFSLDEGIASLDEGIDAWLEDRKVSRIPERFFQEKLEEAAMQMDSLTYVTQGNLAARLLPETLLFPHVRKQEQKRRERVHIQKMKEALEEGDTEAFSLLLDGVQIGSGANLSSIAELLLLDSIQIPTASLSLLTALYQDPYFFAAFALHPDFTDAVWTLPVDHLPYELQLARIVLYADALQTAREYSALAHERFSQELEESLMLYDDPAYLTERVLDRIAKSISELEMLGYPARANALKNTVSHVIATTLFPSDALEALRTQLYSQSYTASVALEAEYVEEVVVDDSDEELYILQPEDVEKLAYAMLRDAGALFTLDYDISADAPNVAAVSGVLFSGASGDRMVDFHVNVVTGVVSDIFVDGEGSFPYSSDFAGFIAWIRK